MRKYCQCCGTIGSLLVFVRYNITEGIGFSRATFVCVCVVCYFVLVCFILTTLTCICYFQRLNMMLVLDPNGALFIYSSFVKVCSC